jgi:hypothetical protein
MYDVLGDKRIGVHSDLKVSQRRIVRDDPAAQVRLKVADQQEHAVIEAAPDPFLVASMNWPARALFSENASSTTNI